MKRWAWLAVGLALVVAAGSGVWLLRDRSLPEATPAAEADLHESASSVSEVPEVPEAPAAPTLSGTSQAAPHEAETPPAEGEPTSPVRVFGGIVVDPNGQPVPGAKVAAWSDTDEPPAVTGEDGSFRLERRRASGYLLVHAWAPGLVAEDARLTIYVGEVARVVLAEGCRVHVTVRSEEGRRPVADARVLALCGDEATASAEWQRQANYTDRAITDTDGAAVVLAHEGLTTLLVYADGFAPAETEPTYVPVEGASIEVLLRRGGVIEVEVVDPDGRPVAGALVHVVCGGAVDASARTDAAGSVRFDDVPGPGTERMYVSFRSPSWAPTARQIDPPEPGAVRLVELRVGAGRTVTGTAQFSNGQPVPGAKIYAKPTESAWFWSEELRDAPHRTTTDAEGRFRLEHVAPGGLDVWAFFRPQGYVANREVVVPAEGPVPEVDLVEERTRGGVAIVLRVVDAEGQSVSGACVDAHRIDVEDPDDDGFLIRELSDVSGRARFRDLPAQPLRFVAFTDDFPYTPIDVDLSARAPEEVELRIPGGVVEGKIHFPDGTPARVELYLEFLPEQEQGWRSGWPRVDTDADGRFRFQGLGDGVFSICLCTDGLRLVKGPRTFRAGERCEWTVAKDEVAPHPTSLEVRDQADSTPIEGTVEVLIDGEWIEFEPVGEPPGVYACEDLLDPGSYTVRVRSEGFLDALVADVTVGGTAPTRVEVLREVGAVLEGLLLAEDGRPMPYAAVEAGHQWFQTEEDGRFRLRGLPDGEVEIEIRGSFVRPSKRTVTVDRAAPTRVEWRFPVAGAVALLIPVSAVPAHAVQAHVRARSVANGTERKSMTGLGPWLASAGPGSTPEPWVLAAFLDALEPGVWTIEMQWGGKACPEVEVTVTGLETTAAQITPR